MKEIARLGAQGDVLFLRIGAIPATAQRRPESEEYVVAHSETGHHHVALRGGRSLSVYDDTANPLVSYLEFRGGPQPIEHLRGHDTHETIALLERADETLRKIDGALGAASAQSEPSRWKVVRQRQATPEGWARVAD